MDRPARIAHIRWRAVELARSGSFYDHRELEHYLVNTEHLIEARTVLKDAYLRDDLDRICSAARKLQ